ncbi:hypothetical protein [Curvibacter sp. PAE-UM]|uniref:hypothetical protein n=1 Tax=Curvibacter sp. PAE-UM TaxID=1714344 RepID=UPI00070D9E8C|nr:hypothetical protein [Curvibacter sp. PAE-UM]KRI00121.1 hypothetical protein AO057_14995 [Curvibacter sp. PAE-UM]
MLELERTGVVLRPDDNVPLGLKALHEERLLQYTSELKDCLNAIKHRLPGTQWLYEDVESALTRVVPIDRSEWVPLSEGQNQTFFDCDEAVVVTGSHERQLYDQLSVGH